MLCLGRLDDVLDYPLCFTKMIKSHDCVSRSRVSYDGSYIHDEDKTRKRKLLVNLIHPVFLVSHEKYFSKCQARTRLRSPGVIQILIRPPPSTIQRCPSFSGDILKFLSQGLNSTGIHEYRSFETRKWIIHRQRTRKIFIQTHLFLGAGKSRT